MADMELDFLTDINQHLLTKEGVRGGAVMISHRYARVNAPGMAGSQKRRWKIRCDDGAW